jgi:hypothetical protein
MIGTAELVLFGIQAAIRLAQAVRRAYVEDTAMRGLVIPLPQGLDDPLTHAQQHARAVRNVDRSRYDSLFKEADSQSSSADEQVRRRAAGVLLDLFLRDLADGKVEGYTGNNQLRAGLYAVRQWQQGDEIYPHPLQRVGGALVEIAVDYFMHVPGALEADTKYSQTVFTFLQALERADFQEDDPDSLLVDIFKTAVQTASDHPELFTDDAARQQIIGSILTGVAKESRVQLGAIRTRFGEGNFEQESDLRRYSRIVLQSALRQTSAELLTNPNVIDIHREGQRTLVEHAGAAFLKLVFDETGAEGTHAFADALRRTAAKEGFGQMTLAALRGVSEHPEVFGAVGDQPVEAWLAPMLRDLYQGPAEDPLLFDLDLLPDVACLTIEHGLVNLPVLLNVQDGKRAFTVMAARALFEAIAFRQDDTVRWHFQLTPAEARALFASTLSALSERSEWLPADPESRERLAALLALGAGVIGRADPGLLKALLRSSQLSAVMASLASSGLHHKLSMEHADGLAVLLSQILAAVRAQGVHGLNRLSTEGALNDLLCAVAADAVLECLLADDQMKVQATIAAMVEVIAQLRRGEFIPIQTMIDRLSVSG